MKIITSPRGIQKTAVFLKKAGKTIGFVPTMGALHEGHLSLIKRARKENDVVIVSIFVNPAQFGPNEDYLKYPRPFEKDSSLCKISGVDYIFNPGPEKMYPKGYLTYVNVDKISNLMCGASRPGHFRGVATVVLKFFNLVMPDKAYFGKKDFQQLAILKKMTQDLNVPVKIVPCDTLREKDGLALSSRNVFLSKSERLESVKISQALRLAKSLIEKEKVSDLNRVKKKLLALISSIPGAKLDYLDFRDPETLEPAQKSKLPLLAAVAVRVGKTRLIDNIVIEPKILVE